MKVTATTYEMEGDFYTYETSHHPSKTKKPWSLLRRERGKMKIPPYLERLTEDGWLSVLNCTSHAVYFNLAVNAIRYAEGDDLPLLQRRQYDD